MWNPPPPDVQLNLAHKYNTGRRDIAPSTYSNNSNRNLTSPKISLSQDRVYNPDQHSDHRGDGQAFNFASGPHPIPAMNRPTVSSLPHPRLEKIGPYLTIATLQAYTVLTVVRCLADPAWIVLKDGDDKGVPGKTLDIGELEKSFLACAIAFTMASCLGVTLRILDKFPWLRKIPVMTAYLEGKGNSCLCTHACPFQSSTPVQQPCPPLCPFVSTHGSVSFLDPQTTPWVHEKETGLAAVELNEERVGHDVKIQKTQRRLRRVK